LVQPMHYFGATYALLWCVIFLSVSRETLGAPVDNLWITCG